MAVISSSTASATILTSPAGNQLGAGTIIKGEQGGKIIFDPPFGAIECSQSTLEGETTNSGGASETVNVALSTLTFTSCNATVTVLKKGNLEIHTEGGSANNNGAVTMSSHEITVQYLGTHCVYNGPPVLIGAIVGRVVATIILKSILKRTGGSSGAFCGSTAEWTGTYHITAPGSLYVD